MIYSRLERLSSGYSGLQQVTAGYRSRLPSSYSGINLVTASYSVVTVGNSRLQQVTEWLQRVTEC